MTVDEPPAILRAAMALYDPLTDAELRELCAAFGLDLASAEGVPKGSINTNYRLTCAQGRYFLRYSTVRAQADLEFESGLLSHLRQGGFPCPEPVASRSGGAFIAFRRGFVSIFPYLPGEELAPDRVTADHARAVGAALAKMHRLGTSFGGERGNPYGESTLRSWVDDLLHAELEPDVASAVHRSEAELARATASPGLPRGAIHGDLFRDNVKWLGDRIAAIFDFEMACIDDFALDLGIALCVWTFGEREFDRMRIRGLVEGYRAQRKIRPEEAAALHARALCGAIRFTLSRIRDFHLSKAAPGALAKKPWQRYAQRVDQLVRLGPAGFRDLAGI